MAAALLYEVPDSLIHQNSNFEVENDILGTSQRDRAASISRVKTQGDRTSFAGLFDAVPFTPSQGVCTASPQLTNIAMFSPFAGFHRGTDGGKPVLGAVNSDSSSTSDLSTMLPTSPEDGGLAGYSPFMGVPWGNTVNCVSEPPASSPLDLPGSPMSPGVMFNPSPSGLGAQGSPCALFGSSLSPSPYNLNNSSSALRSTSGSLAGGFLNNSASAAADAAAAAAAAFGTQLPSFYYQAAAAAANSSGAAAAAASNLQLQAALSQTLLGQHSASLAAAQQQQQILQASLSAALAGQPNPFLQGYPSAVLSALEPMRSAGGSISLDGGLQQQASVQAAAALLQQQQQQQQLAAVMAAQQQQQQAHQLRRNLSTPAAVAAQLGLSSAAAAASAQLGLQNLSLSAGGAPLALPTQMGRLHVTHSADLSHLDAAQLLGAQGGMCGMAGRPKFKPRKNSEPKIGPDGQPRLNARQRRTLRRAKERALKGLLEVSQALLQKAEVQVTVPNISHLTALEELAAVEAEKELAASSGGMGDVDGHLLSPCGTSATGKVGSGPAGNGRAPGVTRSQQLAAAAAAVEESVCEIARAAVAAVTAQATGKDTSSAAAAAQAAAAQAASAAASAGAVLPPGFVLPEAEEPTSEDLPACTSDPCECLSHSAPTSPVGSSITASDSTSGRSSSSSCSGSLPGSGRCSSSGSAASSLATAATAGPAAPTGNAAKPPVGSRPPGSVHPTNSSPLCSPLQSPTPAISSGPAGAGKGAGSQLEGIDIAGLIGQLSLKKDEGMVDDKLIRDLQIIQSLIGALKAPSANGGLEGPSGGGAVAHVAACTSPSPVCGATGTRSSTRAAAGSRTMPKRSSSYSPSSAAALNAVLPL